MNARSIARHCVAALAAALLLAAAGVAQGYQPWANGVAVAALDVTWHDAARNRDVPAHIYYPRVLRGRAPLIIFSHGLGGSRFGYAYLGRAWAGAGYICVHLQHAGSDDAVWKHAGLDIMGAMRRSAMEPINALNRAEDVTFAINRMLALDEPGALAGFDPFLHHINREAIGMAGHSFGAWTTLAVTGERMPMGRTLVDARIKAAIAMSAPVPGGGVGDVFGGIKVPVFHMTGTRDNSPIGDTSAAQRRIPYDQSKTPGTCLLILNGADHMTFSGHLLGNFGGEDAKFQVPIVAGSIAFWDATLRHDAEATRWLYGAGFQKSLDGLGTFEMRQP